MEIFSLLCCFYICTDMPWKLHRWWYTQGSDPGDWSGGSSHKGKSGHSATQWNARIHLSDRPLGATTQSIQHAVWRRRKMATRKRGVPPLGRQWKEEGHALHWSSRGWQDGTCFYHHWSSRKKKYANDESVAITYLYFDYRQRIEFTDLLSGLLNQNGILKWNGWQNGKLKGQ